MGKPPPLLTSTSGKPLKYIDAEVFTDWVAKEIRHGFRLVPFVGSGMSHASGTTMGQGFIEYLTWAVHKCVVVEGVSDPFTIATEEDDPRWNLKKKGWPDFPKPQNIETAKTWLQQRWNELSDYHKEFNRAVILRKPALLREGDDHIRDQADMAALWVQHEGKIVPDFLPRPETSTTSEVYVQECAVRALCDWQTALHFLARLQQWEKGLPLQLGERADQSVIDSFNYFMTSGRKPNLGHNMLCHLAGRARITTILTTNFDTLIEDAFAQMGDHYEVFQVSINGGLPPPQTALGQNSIIKLHGGYSETRADHSIDYPPTPEDLDRFFNYVRGCPPKQPAKEENRERFLPGLLLVCGYSASDLRCVQMIKHVLNVDRDAKVLWICHTRSDLEKVNRIFGREYRIADGPGLDLKDYQIIPTITDRTDLLMFELYQRITLSLPRGGFNYQFVHSMPPEESIDSPRKCDEQPELVMKVRESLDKGKITIVNASSGLMAPLRLLFRQEANSSMGRAIWIEMEDYPDPISIAHEVFVGIAIQIGRFQRDHARLLPARPYGSPGENRQYPTKDEWALHISKLCQHWRIEPDRWFLLFYGRNVPGLLAGWDSRPWTNDSNVEFENFLQALTEASFQGRSREVSELGPGSASSAKSAGFRVVYAPYTRERHQHFQRKQKELQIADDDLKASKRNVSIPSENAAYHKDNDEWRKVEWSQLEIGGEGEGWFSTGISTLKGSLKDHFDGRRNTFKLSLEHRALYAAMLFRQSRHFSAFQSEALYPCPHRFQCEGLDNDWKRHQEVRKWIQQWNRKFDLFLRKPGGFYWAYQDMRLAVRELIERRGPVIFKETQRDAKPAKLSSLKQNRSRDHFLIGDWYGKAYRVTGHILPLLESLHHFSQCLAHLPDYKPATLNDKDPKERKKVFTAKLRLARQALFEMTKSMVLGSHHLRFWSQDQALIEWLSRKEYRRETQRQFGPDLSKLESQITKFLRKCENPKFFGGQFSSWCRDLQTEVKFLTGRGVQTGPEIRRFWHTQSAERGYVTLFTKGNVLAEALVKRNATDWLRELQKMLRPSKEPSLAGVLGLSKAPLHELLTHFTEYLATNTSSASSLLDMRVKDWRNRVLVEICSDFNKIYLLAQGILELAYIFAQRAKREDHANWLWVGFRPHRKVRKLWVGVSTLCWLTLDLCYDLPPSSVVEDCKLRIKAQTIYGLALGWLGRFHEAHRRFNEAHAWLSKSQGAVEPLELGIIKLREAEVHLLEAVRFQKLMRVGYKDSRARGEDKNAGLFVRSVRSFKTREDRIEKDTLKQWASMYFPDKLGDYTEQEIQEVLLRMHCAKLDDAWMELEGAERVLSGKTHSTLWWGRLHNLRLRLIANHWHPGLDGCEQDIQFPFRALTFRKAQDHFETIQKSYRAGLLSSKADNYHRLRLIEYAYRSSLVLVKLGEINENNPEYNRFIAETLIPDWQRVHAALGVDNETLLKDYSNKFRTVYKWSPKPESRSATK